MLMDVAAELCSKLFSVRVLLVDKTAGHKGQDGMMVEFWCGGEGFLVCLLC
jgi:hypothetical protein